MEKQRRDCLNHGNASRGLQLQQLGRHWDRLLFGHGQSGFNHNGWTHHRDGGFHSQLMFTTSDLWPLAIVRGLLHTAAEQRWNAPAGRAVDLRAETDGDLHIELQDATGDKPGIVVVEVPEKPQWCENH